MTPIRMGIWSAWTVLAMSVAYLVVLTVGVWRAGLEAPIVDPVLAVMEVLTLASALPLVTLVSALLVQARPERRLPGIVSLVFITLFAGTTTAVHFVGLTAGRQMGGGLLVWPSTSYALELLAWDVFLGLALLAAAATVEGAGRGRAARGGLIFSGALCLVGTMGPILGNLRLQRVGVVGYAIGLPVAAWLLLRWFAGARTRPAVV